MDDCELCKNKVRCLKEVPEDTLMDNISKQLTVDIAFTWSMVDYMYLKCLPNRYATSLCVVLILCIYILNIDTK